MTQDARQRITTPYLMGVNSDSKLIARAPRDKAFKLVEFAFLQLLPTARTLRPKLFYTLIGFDAQTALRSIYERNNIAGIDLGSGEEDSSDLLRQLDDASKIDAKSRLDFLSVSGCACSMQTLDMVCLGTFRPGVIHCADVDTFADWLAVRQGLLVKGYAFVGGLEGAELFLDEALFNSPTSSDDRPTIATFDVFDTLIARRCIEPWRVFAMVGDRMGLPDFVDQRRAAEQRVISSLYNYDDIYVELGKHYGFDTERLAEVKACEIACELDVVIPIAENMARVADGDLLISDMYLGEAQIRGLVEKAGLRRSIGLLVSSHGKSAGLVWPKVKNVYSIVQHLGDNQHADGVMAGRAGITNEITRASDMNVVETMFMQAGLIDLARLSREARLATWHPDPAIRMLQIVQTSINFPLLLLASVHLARTAERAGRKTLLFCSRDCNLWHPLFDRVARRIGFEGKSQYFMTSRMARITASSGYKAYTRKSLSNDGMIIDLCGTGWSTANLIEKVGLTLCHTYFIDHRAPLAAYESKAKTPDTCITHKLLKTDHGLNNAVLECASYAEHPMCVNMIDIDGTMLPVFAPDSRTARELEIVATQRQAFFVAMRTMEHYKLEDVLSLDDPSIEMICLALYGYLNKQSGAFDVFAQSFHAENNAIVNKLTSIDRQPR